jgi:hypothetical protein
MPTTPRVVMLVVDVVVDVVVLVVVEPEVVLEVPEEEPEVVLAAAAKEDNKERMLLLRKLKTLLAQEVDAVVVVPFVVHAEHVVLLVVAVEVNATQLEQATTNQTTELSPRPLCLLPTCPSLWMTRASAKCLPMMV